MSKCFEASPHDSTNPRHRSNVGKWGPGAGLGLVRSFVAAGPGKLCCGDAGIAEIAARWDVNKR